MHNPPKVQPQTVEQKRKSGEFRPPASLFKAKPVLKHLQKTLISEPRHFNRCYKSYLKYSSHLTISSSDGLPENQIINLSHQRGAFKRLPKLTLDSFIPRNLNLKRFSRLLKNLRNLQSFKSQARLSSQDPRYNLKDLFRGIRTLKALTSLHLDLEFAEVISRTQLKRLLACLKQLPNLYRLKLYIKSATAFAPNPNPNNLGGMMINIPNIQDPALIINAIVNNQDQDPNDIVNAILNNQNPPPAGINNQNPPAAAAPNNQGALGPNPNANNQNPPAAANNQNLPPPIPPIEDYTYLSTGIKRLKNLRALEFTFTFLNEVTDLGIEKVLIQIQEFDLLSLHMNFLKCPRVGSKILPKIGATLDKFKSLNSFALAMPDVQGIRISHFLQFCFALNSRRSTLVFLDLNFSQCDVLDALMMDCITSAIKNAINLRFLRLNFSYGTFFDKGVGELILMLKSLKSLNSLHLDCGFCPNITTFSVDFLCRQLETLGHIKKCNLFFEDCPQVDSDEVTKELLANLVSRNVLYFDGIFRTTGNFWRTDL